MSVDNLTVVQVAPVASLANTGVGDYVYRIGQPSEEMGKLRGVTVINVSNMSPYLTDICLAADVLVLHLVGEVDMLPLVAERKRQGFPTIYEISDNFMAFPPSSRIKSWFEDPINLATTFQLIQMADGIQGVSDILLRRFKFLHEHYKVFENQIKDVCQKPPRYGEGLVIGWGGSTGHTEDIKWIAPVI